MQKMITNALKFLDATDKEIQFFIASYSLGPSSINEIAKIAKLERSTTYMVAQNLIKRGLITEDFKQYNKTLTAAEPEALIRMLAAKKRKIGRQEIVLKDNLDQLTSSYDSTSALPRVRVYEGQNGLLSVWKDIISKQQEVLLWTNQETEENIFSKENHQLFIQSRLNKNIKLRVLAVNNPSGRKLVEKDHLEQRQTKVLPKDISFSAETYIYGDKIATLDFNKNIIGIIIESAQISQAQRAIFEMNWRIFS